MNLFEQLILACENREGYSLPASMRTRLATMFRRGMEKAIVVGWLADGQAEADTASILRAAERAVHDTL